MDLCTFAHEKAITGILYHTFLGCMVKRDMQLFLVAKMLFQGYCDQNVTKIEINKPSIR